MTTIIKSITNVAQVYHRADFKITMALMYREFAPLKGDLAALRITLNETGHDEHVGDIEQCIHTVKEQILSLPFPLFTG